MDIEYDIKKETINCFIDSLKTESSKVRIDFCDVDSGNRICTIYKPFGKEIRHRPDGTSYVVKSRMLNGRPHNVVEIALMREKEERIIHVINKVTVFFQRDVYHKFTWYDKLNNHCSLLDIGNIEIDSNNTPVLYKQLSFYVDMSFLKDIDSFINNYIKESYINYDSVKELLEKQKEERDREDDIIKKLREKQENSIIVANSYANSMSYDDEASMMYAIKNGYGDMIGY